MSLNPKLQHYIDLIFVLTQKELKVRYKSSILGYLWSVAHPLAFAVVYYIAFKIVIKIQVENYALFLICGLFPWQWFANSVGAAPMVFLGNAALIKKVNFARNMIPFTLVLQDMVHFIFAMPVMILFLYISGKGPSPQWFIGVPILAVSQFLLVYGLCLFIATANLFFRDLERLVTVFMTILFYATPVFYPVEMVPDRFQGILRLNPLAPLVISWRGLLMEGTLKSGDVLLSFFYGFIMLCIGILFYRKLSWRFAEVL